MKQTFSIKGMSCAACSAAVENAVNRLKPVKQAKVNLLLNTLFVDYDERVLSAKDITAAVENAGYKARLQTKTSQLQTAQENKSQKIFLAVSFILLIALMYISMGGMLALPFIDKLPYPALAVLQMLLTIPIVVFNFKYFISGFKALLHLTPNMDSLIAIGSGASLLYSFYNTAAMFWYLNTTQSQTAQHFYHNLYFESAAVILAVISLGKYIENKAKDKTSAAIEKLVNLSPKITEIEKDGKIIKIPSENLQAGDIIIIKSGQSLPADGTIIQGTGFLNESFITGESLPVEKSAGQKVICATINTDGYFKYRAEKVGDNTTLAQIIDLMKQANSSKPQIAKLADKISAVFVPAVIIIAFISAAIWLLSGYGFAFALNCAVCVLVISCPCALGLATPTAIMCATGNAAKNGILIKKAQSIQTGVKIDSIVLDKTGTLTQGEPAVTDIISEDKPFLLQLAAALENLSSHPLAKAITNYAAQNNITPQPAINFTYHEGLGIKADYKSKKAFGGNLKFIQKENADYYAFKQKAEELSSQGKTVLFFAYENKVCGIIALADKIKSTSKQAVMQFKQMGLDVYMLTGDNKNTAAYIAKQLNIKDFKAEILPADKELFVKELQLKGRQVAMIGDGINDAPALARADLALAIGAGSDIAIESADIVLMHKDLTDAVYALKLSRSAIKNIKQNLFWALFYNTLGIPLAAGVFYKALGWQLSPMVAATAMALSSVCVVLNALRLTKFNIEKTTENTMKITLYIEGMACGHCAQRVQSALETLGVNATVDLKTKTAQVQAPQQISKDQLKTAVENAGYKVIKIN